MKNHILRNTPATMAFALLASAPALPQEGEPLLLQPDDNSTHVTIVPIDAASLDDGVPAGGAPTVRALDLGDEWVASATESRQYLGFAAGRYVPPAEERIDPLLAARVAQLQQVSQPAGRPTNEVYAFVMFSRRITDERKARLEASGARILGFHPGYNLKVALAPAALEDVAALPFVRWIGEPRPWQKVHPVLATQLADPAAPSQVDVVVSVFESDLSDASTFEAIGALELAQPATAATLRIDDEEALPKRWMSNGWQQAGLLARGANVSEYEDPVRVFHASVARAEIESLLELDYVQFIEPEWKNELAHGESMTMVNADRVRINWDGGTNAAAIVGIVDSGYDNSHWGLNHTWRAGWSWVPGEGPWSDGYGHGSHVAGTLLGDGGGDFARRGVAPGLGATQPLSVYVLKIFDENGDSFGSTTQRLDRLTTQYSNVPIPHVVNHSYGVPGSGFVGTEFSARAFDDSVRETGQLHVFAAGNEGPGSGSLRLQATAKNVLTVGNVVNYDAPGVGEPGSLWTSSSRGPAADGRWKPNVVGRGARSGRSTPARRTDTARTAARAWLRRT